MERFDFDTVIDRKNTACLKYDFAGEYGVPEDTLPFWIADMDFKVADCITDALRDRVEHGIYGYSDTGVSYFRALAGWEKKHFNWDIRPEWLIKTPGVVPAINIAVKALTEENDAGLARGLEPYSSNDVDDIIQTIDTNIKGLFLVTRAFLPAMLKRNTGHIINLGSTAGLYAYAGAAVYCSTKAAVKTFSDGIRIEVIDSDIKVTTIQPGIVETPFSEVRFHGDKERAAAVYEGIDALQAEDIADIIVFAVNRPKRVQISDIVVMANQQGTGFLVSKKK